MGSVIDGIVVKWVDRPYGAPFVSEVRESGPWRTSVTARSHELLKQTAPHTTGVTINDITY